MQGLVMVKVVEQAGARERLYWVLTSGNSTLQGSASPAQSSVDVRQSQVPPGWVLITLKHRGCYQPSAQSSCQTLLAETPVAFREGFICLFPLVLWRWLFGHMLVLFWTGYTVKWVEHIDIHGNHVPCTPCWNYFASALNSDWDPRFNELGFVIYTPLRCNLFWCLWASLHLALLRVWGLNVALLGKGQSDIQIFLWFRCHLNSLYEGY